MTIDGRGAGSDRNSFDAPPVVINPSGSLTISGAGFAATVLPSLVSHGSVSVLAGVLALGTDFTQSRSVRLVLGIFGPGARQHGAITISGRAFTGGNPPRQHPTPLPAPEGDDHPGRRPGDPASLIARSGPIELAWWRSSDLDEATRTICSHFEG